MYQISNKNSQNEVNYKKGPISIKKPILEYLMECDLKNKSNRFRVGDNYVMAHLKIERSKYYRLKNGTGDMWIKDLLYIVAKSGKPLNFWLMEYPWAFDDNQKINEYESIISELKASFKEKEELLKFKIKALEEKLADIKNE